MTYKMYGWFDDPDQEIPTYEPPRDAPCYYCNKPVTPHDLRCHSMTMAVDKPQRAYFYRTHTTCDLSASEFEREQLFKHVLETIERNGDAR